MEKLKTVCITVLAGLLIAVSVFAYVQARKNVKNSEAKTAASTVPVDVKQEIVKQFKDSLTHETHATFTNKAKGLSSVSVLSPAALATLDTVSRAIDVKASQVVDYKRITQVSEAKNLKAEKTIDSLKRVLYKYSNGTIAMSFLSPDSLHKEGEFGYRYNQKLKTVNANTRKFLGIPIGKDIIDISSTDPNSTIEGLEAFSIRPAERFFGAEVQGLGSYNFRSKGLSPGLGLQLKLGRLYISPAAYYNLDTRVLNPVVTGRFAILKY